jgi:Fic family protein
MNKRLGTYITQTNSEKAYKAYVPPALPPTEPPLAMPELYPYLEKATVALTQLNNVAISIPNPSLFMYMYIRKEALLSSQIEGTQSSFSDLILFENHQKPYVSLDDVEEVSNYVKAITYGLERMKNDFPLSLRLLREIHEILLAGSRGSSKYPGQFRRTQNWIGGTKPETAFFVPPPVEQMHVCLSDFEHFLHDTSLPALLKAGLAHVQFETIHPFLDGNGRLGRLLITLLLCQSGLLTEPVLYLSLYLKQNRNTYYDLLQQVRETGNWEKWLIFFLEGISSTCAQAVTTTTAINLLFETDSAKIESLGRAKFSCLALFDYLKKLPQVTAPLIAQELRISPPTARTALANLAALGIVEEMSGKQRDKVYVYRHYLTLLAEGTNPLP